MRVQATTLIEAIANRLGLRKKTFLVVLAGFIGFCVSIASLTTVHIGTDFTDIGLDEFFFLQVIPVTYWLGIFLMVLSILYVSRLHGQANKWGILLAGLLIVAIRIILNASLTNPTSYDAMRDYVPQLESWLQNGVQFVPNTYAHDWPLSFILAYIFTKAGMPVTLFYNWAQIPFYFVEAYLVSLIARRILDQDRVSLTVFLFGLVPLTQEGGLLTLFFNPQLIGSVFYLLSLYLILGVMTKKERFRKDVILLSLSVTLMILSHHLTVIYFVLTLLGLWFLSKNTRARFTGLNSQIIPFMITYTCVMWLMYSIIAYPARFTTWGVSFLEIVLAGTLFSSGFTSTGYGSFMNLPLLDKLSFMAYPLFIGSLFMIQIRKTWQNDFVRSKQRVFPIDMLTWKPFFLTVGMISLLGLTCVFGLIFNGVLYPIRIIEIILFSLCVLGNKSILELLSSKSNSTRILTVLTALIITFLSIFWMYRIVQRTIPSLIIELS